MSFTNVYEPELLTTKESSIQNVFTINFYLFIVPSYLFLRGTLD